MQARTLDDCLNADEAMARLAAHAGRLLSLQRLVQAAVPAALARACRVANYKLGVIVINADNGAVATKLRQLAPRLGDELRSNGVELSEIRVKVQPRDAAPAPSTGISLSAISDRTKQGLTSLSAELPQGSPLKEALERLVGRAS
ncbi:MAG TPA: DciA family protein [Rhodocyclaceae bacterium]|nr:DciA family protein [Rhodocyclaceae bacterium]